MGTFLLLSLLACGDKDGVDSGWAGTHADGGGSDAGAGDGGSSDGGSSDGGSSDGGSSDGGSSDGGSSDGGSSDGGSSDGGAAADGLGALTGDCGVLDDELTAADPSAHYNELDLTGTSWDEDLLSEGGLEVYEDGNLGGSSLYSEVFAYEVLYRCEDAALQATETEISYVDDSGKKTDLVVTIDGIRLGVSVTRAYVWENDDAYTVDEATDLLTDKLGDVLLSSANVDPGEAWDKQILSVIAYGPDYALALGVAWEELDPAVRADTILYVTVTEGDDEYLY